MKNMQADSKSGFLVIVFTLACLSGISQTSKTIDSLQARYQACLDKGRAMVGCSGVFYFQMDSLLNLQYKNLRAGCDSIQKENLKKEQLGWLSQRDHQFRQNQQKIHQEAVADGYDGGQDERMMILDKNAGFVKERVLVLMKKFPTDYSNGPQKRGSF